MTNRKKRRNNIKRNRNKPRKPTSNANNSSANKKNKISSNKIERPNNSSIMYSRYGVNNMDIIRDSLGDKTSPKRSTVSTTIPSAVNRKVLLTAFEDVIENSEESNATTTTETMKITHQSHSISIYNIDKGLTNAITKFENKYRQ